MKGKHDKQKIALIILAARIARCENMVDPEHLGSRATKRDREKCHRALYQCRQWAAEVGKIADEL